MYYAYTIMHWLSTNLKQSPALKQDPPLPWIRTHHKTRNSNKCFLWFFEIISNIKISTHPVYLFWAKIPPTLFINHKEIFHTPRLFPHANYSKLECMYFIFYASLILNGKRIFVFYLFSDNVINYYYYYYYYYYYW